MRALGTSRGVQASRHGNKSANRVAPAPTTTCVSTQHSRHLQVVGSNSTSSSATSQPSSSSRSTPGPVLVDGLVVQPAYRSTPWEAEAKQAAAGKQKAVLMFVSESGICRGPLAAATFKQMLQESHLRDWIEVQMRASRDYCIGQEPHPAAVQAAQTLGIQLSLATTAASSSSSSSTADEPQASSRGVTVFDPSEDIVAADLVLVCDKYTAADVLREVSSYDLINPGGHYSARVRVLGSFHPQLAGRTQTPDGQDIDDALYGNVGGQEEQEIVLAAAKLVVESCRNLLQQLEDLAVGHGLIAAAGKATATEDADAVTQLLATAEPSDAANAPNGSKGAAFRDLLVQHVRQDGVIDWLVPPMLQGPTTDLGGWV